MMKLLTLYLILFCSSFSFGQDPSFSQPSNNLTYLNPAFTGTARSLRSGFSYRNQWTGISGDFITTNLYVDQNLGQWGGAGITYIHDLAGQTITSDNIYLDYAYQFEFGNESVLSIGVEIGYIQKSLDWSKFTFGDMIDARRGFVYQTGDLPRGGVAKNFDLGGGILYYNKSLFAGYGLHHINQPNLSFFSSGSKLPMLHSIYAGGIIKLGYVTVSPQLDVKVQDSFQSVLGLVKANYKWVTIGAGYRVSDAYVWYLGVGGDRIKVGYSYDGTISALKSVTGGSHEISFTIFFKTTNKMNERALGLF